MKLVQVRECDGACCRESPRFPNKDKTNCIYRDRWGCKIQRGLAEVPTPNEAWAGGLGYTNMEAFEETCAKWPHNMPDRDTGNCCWQWVDED